MIRLTRQETSKLLGIAPGTMSTWQNLGLIPASGSVTLTEALAVGVGRALKQFGIPFHQCAPVVAALWKMPLEQLEAAFASGRCYLLVLGNVVCPRLLSLDACANPDGIDVAKYTEMTGIRPAVYNVYGLWQIINKELAKMRAAKREKVNQN